MSDDHMKVAIDLDVRSTGEELVAQLTRQLSKLESQIKSINAVSKSAAQASRPQTSGRNPSSAETSTAQSEAKAKRQSLIFDRESAKVFKTRIASQARAAADAMRAERQSFADYKSRVSAKARYDASEVRGLRARMQAEARISAMRIRAENDAVQTLKAKIASQDRAARQRVNEATATARAEAKSAADSIRGVRDRIASHSRMMRQRIAEETAAQRDRTRSIAETAREEARRAREQAASIKANARLEVQGIRQAERERSRFRRSFMSHGREAGRSTSEAYQKLSRPGPIVAAVAAGTAGVATRRGISTRSDVDAAETQLRIFGSEPASRGNPGSTMTQADVVKLRKEWLDRSALDNGMSAGEAIRAYTEVLKAGVDPTKARDVTEQLMASRAGMDLDLSEITKITGKVLTNRPDLDLKKWQNSFAIAAGTTAADPREIVQGYQRGMGALAGTNMSPEDLTAFIGTGIGAGIQAGKTGNFVAETATTLQNAGNERGQRRKDLDQAARLTGFGNARGMSSAMSRDAAGTLEALFERMSKLDAKTKALVARRLGGREWDDEELQMVNSVATLKKTRQAVNDPRNADYLDRAKAEKMNSWGGMWSKTLSVFSLFWEKFGAGFDEILRDINAFFADIGRTFDFSKVTQAVKAAVDGIKQGLGISSWKEGLQSIAGSIAVSDFPGLLASITGFFRGFIAGIKGFVDSVRGFFGAFGVGDAETIGKWTGRVLALSVALAALSPVLTVLGGLVALIQAISAAAMAASALKGLSAGSVAGAAAWTIAGQMIGVAFLATVANKLGILKAPDVSKGFGRGVVEFLDPGLASRIYGDDKADTGKTEQPRAWTDPPAKMTAPKTWTPLVPVDPRPEIRELRESLDQNSFIHRQSLDRETGIGSLIHKASISTMAPADAVRSSVTESASGIRNAVLSGSTGSGSMTGGLGPLGNSIPGLRLNAGGGLGYRGIIGGSGSSRGPGPGNGGMVGFGANPSAYKPVLDYIAGTEGTAGQAGGGYSTSLGYGKFLPGGKEQSLTGKTLDEIDALQSGMLSHPQNGFNSSAIGRYQIVRKTLRGLRQQLGLKGSDLFNETMQDRLGAELVRQRGSNAAGLGQEWASLRGGKASQAAALVGNIPAGSSTTPSNRPVADGVVGPVTAGAAANVADNAAKLIGSGSSQAAMQLGSKMTPSQWCADFVNGSLKSANIRGVNSSIANSFLTWGQEVTDGVRKGDVLVEHRGRGVGMPGGHAGVATGESRQGPRGLQYEMISGNHGNRVGRSWEDAGKVVARRAMESTTAAAEAAKFPDLNGFTPPKWKVPAGSISSGLTDKAETIRSNAWRPSKVDAPTLGDGPLGSATPARPSLGESVPPRVSNTSPIGGGGGNGGKVSSSSINAPITINGTGMDPHAIANAVQRKLSEDMNRRTHDISPSII